jgi:hypothetical protein
MHHIGWRETPCSAYLRIHAHVKGGGEEVRQQDGEARIPDSSDESTSHVQTSLIYGPASVSTTRTYKAERAMMDILSSSMQVTRCFLIM